MNELEIYKEEGYKKPTLKFDIPDFSVFGNWQRNSTIRVIQLKKMQRRLNKLMKLSQDPTFKYLTKAEKQRFWKYAGGFSECANIFLKDPSDLEIYRYTQEQKKRRMKK